MVPRDDVIFAKGKGRLRTWFLHGRKSDTASSAPSDASTGNMDVEDDIMTVKGQQRNPETDRSKQTKRVQQLIEWNANLLQESLKKVVDHRGVKVDMSDDIRHQVTDFVTEVASRYNENAFHSFEHASHVTMSVKKSKLFWQSSKSVPPQLYVSLCLCYYSACEDQGRRQGRSRICQRYIAVSSDAICSHGFLVDPRCRTPRRFQLYSCPGERPRRHQV